MKIFSLLILLTLGTLAVADSKDPNEVCPGRGPWLSVDCRPHVGECYNSCADHRYCAIVDEDKCPRDVNPYEVNCYCATGG